MTERTSGDERRAALEARASANAPRALLAQALTALAFLTIVRPGGPRTTAVGESALFFPLVGLLLGAVLAATDAALAPALPAGARALVLVGLLAALTGGSHLAAVARAASAGRDEPERAWSGRGALAAGTVAALEALALARLPGGVRGVALLLAPALGRWSMVALAFGSRSARAADAGLVRAIKFREFAGASVLALGVTLARAEARGLAAIFVLAVVVIGCRVLAHRLAGGVAADLVVALALVNETLALAVFGLGAR